MEEFMEKFDPEIKFWKKFKKSKKWSLQNNMIEKKYWEKIFDLTYKKKSIPGIMRGQLLHGIIINYQ